MFEILDKGKKDRIIKMLESEYDLSSKIGDFTDDIEEEWNEKTKDNIKLEELF